MANQSDLKHVHAVGYVLIRRTNRLVAPRPEPLVSLSRCICPQRLDITWGWRSAILRTFHKPERDFGIPSDLWDLFAAWCSSGTANDGADWGVFSTPQGARRFADQFRLATGEYWLIGIGRPRDIEPPGKEIFNLYDERAATVWRESPFPLETGGIVLGYEIASFDYGDFGHSWLCSGLEKDMNDLYGIVPNAHGLIGEYNEAQTVCDWIAEDEMRGTRAEPEPYFTWLLVSYPFHD